jgi:hypothetical protein
MDLIVEEVAAAFLGYGIKIQRLVFWVLGCLVNGKRGLWL